LRGVVGGTLKVKVLKEGLHSGNASGIVPDSFRILRKLLSRIEDEETGEILIKDFHAKIPEQRIKQAKNTVKLVGDEVWSKFKFFGNTTPMDKDNVELLLNQTYRPKLTITGQSGLPDIEKAGNVVRTETSLKLSLRLPPTLDSVEATKKLEEILTKDPPYNSTVEFTGGFSGNGWDSPEFEDWLLDSIDNASKSYFKKEAGYFGEGGSIPFMGDLGRKFPKAQFCVVGVLGPGSNAHSVNEFLHIPFVKKLNCCIASILYDHSHNKKNHKKKE